MEDVWTELPTCSWFDCWFLLLRYHVCYCINFGVLLIHSFIHQHIRSFQVLQSLPVKRGSLRIFRNRMLLRAFSNIFFLTQVFSWNHLFFWLWLTMFRPRGNVQMEYFFLKQLAQNWIFNFFQQIAEVLLSLSVALFLQLKVSEHTHLLNFVQR